MNAFEQAKTVEYESLQILIPLIESRSHNGQYVITDKGRLSKELQKRYGDVIMNNKSGEIITIDLKAERENIHGNIFLETWSNLQRYNPGWMIHLDIDLLLYHFIKNDELYCIDFLALRKWAFQDGRIYRFPEKPQSKYTQMNDTWGRCVPIYVLEDEINMRMIHPSQCLKTNGQVVEKNEEYYSSILNEI